MTELEKEQLIMRYIEAYNSKDVDGMVACAHDEVVFRNMAGDVVNMEIYGKNSLIQLATQTLQLFKVREQSIKKITHDDDNVRVDIGFTAEFAMDLPNGVKAGDKMSVEGFSLFEFKDGLLSKISDCA